MAQKTVTVKKGDTLGAIAKANKTTVAAIAKANPSIKNVNVIKVGQKVVIPGATSATTTKPTTSTVTTTPTTTTASTNPATLSTTAIQTRDTFSMAELESKYKIAAGVLKSNPSLQQALAKILGDPKTGEGMVTDPYLQEQIIKGTDWFRTQTDKQRQFDYAKQTNPGQFQADLQSNASEIVRKFSANGLKITAQEAITYAEQMMKESVIQNGKVISYDKNYLNQVMANAIDFTQTGKVGTNDKVVYTKLSGNMETLAKSLYKQAWDYGYDRTMSNEGFTKWFETSMKGLVAGTLNAEQVDDVLQARAKSFAPGLANLIDQGQTLREAAEPWLQSIADVWETNVNEIDLNDEYVQRALNVTDEKGNVQPINLYDTKKLARRSAKWDTTQNAKEEKTRIANRILQDFGFLG
jgi:murein DD-endopeptidase MepM/ murein hydrolase activator NlpD